MSRRARDLAIRGMRAVACMALLAATCGMCQNSTGIPPATTDTARALRTRNQSMADDLFIDSTSPATLQKRLLQLEAARHKSMVADADRLQKLAAQLNAERTKRGGPLTGDQLHNLGEIEKLAHRLKDMMREDIPINTNLMTASPLR